MRIVVIRIDGTKMIRAVPYVLDLPEAFLFEDDGMIVEFVEVTPKGVIYYEEVLGGPVD